MDFKAIQENPETDFQYRKKYLDDFFRNVTKAEIKQKTKRGINEAPFIKLLNEIYGNFIKTDLIIEYLMSDILLISFLRYNYVIINKYQKQPIKETPYKIDVREMYNKESAQVMLMALKPGESLKPHKTPVDVFFFIVEGTPTIHIGTESEVCEKDSLIESPADIVHFISNDSDKLARIMVVKAPRPTNATKVL